FQRLINIAKDKFKFLNAFRSYPDIKYIPVFWRNVKWGDQDYLFKVKREGDRIFNFQANEIYILNQDFNFENFFKNAF
ncbi:hypothetical protein LCGC14_3062040, partial [marine sediment metagenome]